MDRRDFLKAIGAVLVVPFLPARQEPEIIDLHWFQAMAPKGEQFRYSEVRYRVNGGSWMVKWLPVEQVGNHSRVRLTENTFLDFGFPDAATAG